MNEFGSIETIDNIPIKEFAAGVSPFLGFSEKYDEWFGEGLDAWIFHSYGVTYGGKYNTLIYCGIDYDGKFLVHYTVTDHNRMANELLATRSASNVAEAVSIAWEFFSGFLAEYGGFVEIGNKRYICRDLECFNCFVEESTLVPRDTPWFNKKEFNDKHHVEFVDVRKKYLSEIEEQIEFSVIGTREDIIRFVAEEIGVYWRSSYSESEIDEFLEEYKQENN